ncbi:FAD:protein FMN transferase [Butyribacter sp.]|uniref:FAD:protein FMN transferase n=1 Tax=Butyribacter sp. TaxID=2822465 RepID=UPI002A997844|nr:FAD:protein FMN transferase [Butyribacter sp.]
MKKSYFRLSGVLLFLLCIAMLTACQNSDENKKVSKDIFAMDTYMTVTAYGKNAENGVNKAVDEINRLETVLSAEKQESDIYKLNETGSGTLSTDTKDIVSKALEINKTTNGAFDISIYPLMVKWGFTTQKYNVPSKNEISKLLKDVDSSKIIFDEKSGNIKLKENMKIDLGGIAKGYTSNRVMQIFKECGVKSGLVSLGGNVQALGTKTDGTAWQIAIENPDKSSDYIGVVSVKDKAVITSGGYERYFEKNGKTYHHILDPETGYPAESGLKSVTIVSDDGTLADALSTSLFVMGKEKALDYWREHKNEFDTVLVEDNGDITITGGLEKIFKSNFKFDTVK